MKNNDKQSNLDLLGELGIGEKEAEIYLALISNGPMLPQHLAQQSGLKRTTLYNLFPEMIQSKLIYEVKQGKRRLLAARTPEKVFEDYENRYKEIKQNVANLTTIFRMQGLKPDVEIYEGLAGIKQVYNDTLEQKGEILSYNRIANYNAKANEWLIKEYIPERIKRKIWLKAIVPANKPAVESLPDRVSDLRQTRFVPEESFPFKIDGMVYGDKIAFTTCEKGKPLVGIIIQSKEIAQTQRALFELAWIGARVFSDKNQKL